MRSVALVILLLLVVGGSLATPRWGDDFDWVGVGIPNHQIKSLTNIGGDTLLIATNKAIWIVRQTDSCTFQDIYYAQIPPYIEQPLPNTTMDGYSIPVPLITPNYIYYGYPNGKFRWNRTSAPIYEGTTHNGLNFSRDTLFTANGNSSGGSELIWRATYPNPEWGPGRSHFYPRYTHNYILHRDRIYRIASTGEVDSSTRVAGVSDWAVRWPYAYGTCVLDSQLVTVNLSTYPPVETSRRRTTVCGFAQIYRDTLVTVQGNRWQCWSLTNPSNPDSIGRTILPFKLFWLEGTTRDSLYFGWGGQHIRSVPASDYCNTRPVLMAFDSTILRPRFADSTLHMEYYSPPSPLQLVHTTFGWIGTSGFYDGLLQGPPYYWAFKISLVNFRPRVDTLWISNYPSNLTYNWVGYTRFTRCDSTLWFYRNYGPSFVADVRPSDGRFTTQECPFPIHEAWRNKLIYNGMIARLESNRWQIDTLKYRSGTPSFNFGYPSVYQYMNDRILIQNYVMPNVYTNLLSLHGDSAILEFHQILSNNRMINFIRDSTFLVSSIRYLVNKYNKNGSSWVLDNNWSVRFDSSLYFTTKTKWDSLVLIGQRLYTVPAVGNPYVTLDLSPLARVLPMPRDTMYEVDISGQTVIVKLRNEFCGLYRVLPDTAILLGTILSTRPTQVNLIGSLAVVVGDNGASMYRVPHFDDVGEPNVTLLPLQYSLSPPYPNPFNSTLYFDFMIPRKSVASYTIYDPLGRLVYSHDFGALTAGKYFANWDGRNASGTIIGSGVYFLQLRSGDFQAVKKVVLVK